MDNTLSQNVQTTSVVDFNINKLLKTYVKPAVGCTEPAAIGLAASTAFYAASGKVPKFIDSSRLTNEIITLKENSIENIDKIALTLDTNVLKNALYVNIPSTNKEHGIDLAAILGIFSTPDKELAIFEAIKEAPEELLKKVTQMGLKQKVSIEKREETGIYINCKITFEDGTVSEALIRGSHANIISIKVNNIDLIKPSEYSDSSDIVLEELKELSVEQMISQVENNLNEESRNLIWKGLLMNLKVAKIGLEEKHGDGIGYAHKVMGSLDKSTEHKIVSYVAAATDVRMEGYNIQVMSSVGSGNQGLIISVSLAVLAETIFNKKLEEFSPEEKTLLINATALAHLITAYTTSYTGMLSNLCGCLCKAGVGASAGMGYLIYHYEDEKTIDNQPKDKLILNSMKNMIASTCGVLCDGAKGSCSNKSKSAGFNAYTSAQEALMKAVGTGGIPGTENTDIKTIMKNFVETYIHKFGQPTDLHIVNYLLLAYC